MKISIITAAYNSGAALKKTIEALLAQNMDGLQAEYWLIDGKSTDDTLTIAEQYRARLEDKGIAFHIVSEPDQGIYDAMNKGIRLATGDVVGLINTGDWYEPEVFQTVREVFSQERCDLMFGDIRIHKQNGQTFIKKARQRAFQTSRDWNHPTMFVRAELHKKNLYLNRGIHDDYGFYLRMRKQGRRIVIVSRVLANFQMGGASNRKSLRAAAARIRDRYLYCYRINGYSRWYLLECVAIEAVKFILG